MRHITNTQVFVNRGTNEFDSRDIDGPEDLEDFIYGDPISHPVVIDGVREPRRIYNMDTIRKCLLHKQSEPFTREPISRNFGLTTVRDLNPDTPYNYEALVQADFHGYQSRVERAQADRARAEERAQVDRARAALERSNQMDAVTGRVYAGNVSSRDSAAVMREMWRRHSEDSIRMMRGQDEIYREMMRIPRRNILRNDDAIP
jgi:hypothetical protein